MGKGRQLLYQSRSKYDELTYEESGQKWFYTFSVLYGVLLTFTIFGDFYIHYSSSFELVFSAFMALSFLLLWVLSANFYFYAILPRINYENFRNSWDRS